VEVIVLVLFTFFVVGFLAYRSFMRIISVTAENLLHLFYKNEEKWWWEKELPLAIQKSGFLTRAALNLLNEEGRLRKRIVLINGIRCSSRDGIDYPGMMLLVQLDGGGNPRKEKEKERMWVKRTYPRPIPLYNTVLHSLNY